MKRGLLAIALIINYCGLSSIAAIRNVPSEYSTIQAAINASAAGDEVVIAPGTYTGAYNTDINFGGKAITVRGATGNPSDCIIDCGGTSYTPHNGFNFTYGENANSILEAITITKGYASYGGGGIYIDSSNPVINNCIISDNSATVGGGIYDNLSNSVKINRCIIRNNSGGWGAGIFNSGGSATISNCAILNNTGTTGCGAAIYNYVSSTANIRNCTISGNIMQGEAVICNAYNNGVRPTISNCIIWGNTASALIHGHTTVTYSDMQGGYLGTGNLNANPLFVNGYHLSGALSGSSVCINSGNPNYVPEPCETDLDGNPRVLYGRIDMGAYEFVTPAPGDIDGDGDIDYGDFVLFKAAFTFTQRSPNYTLRADLDADGCVTFVDYQQWLALYNEANHLTGMSSAAPAVAGDLDGDQDVDFYDFAVFAASFDNSSPIAFEDLQFIALHWLECWRFDCP